MRSGTRPTGAMALACVLAGGAGCAQIVGNDEYEVGSASTNDDGDPISDPPPPFLTGAECEACATKACATELANCFSSAVCSDWLSGMRDRPDPLSAYVRHKVEMELEWSRDHGVPYDGAIFALKNCSQKCLSACEIGQDYSCVGKFDWEFASPFPPEELRTFMTDYLGNVKPPSSVTACSSVDQCAGPLGSASSNDGFAVLRLSGAAPVDYLSFELNEFVPWHYLQTRPLAHGDYVPTGFYDASTVLKWHSDFGYTFDGDSGLVVLQPRDCTGMFGKQLFVEVWLPSGGVLKPCPEPDCVYAYADGPFDSPNVLLNGFKNEGHVVYVVAPARQIYLTLRRIRQPQEIVSVVPVNVEPGEFTFVKAFPLSRRDLEAVPDLTR
jgi:hypothetical protein